MHETTRDDSTDDTATDDDGRTTPDLSATPTDALVDEPLRVVVAGLRPDQHATVTAEFADLDSHWEARATFEADADGRIDLSGRAPVAGDYADVRPMGLVQFATPVEDPADGDANDEAADAYLLRLAAEVDGNPVAETTVTRHVRAPGVERVDPDPEADGVAGECYLPAGEGPHPGVVVFHGSGGEPLDRFGKVLASRGFAALALRYVGGPDPVPDRFEGVPVEYLCGAVDWLRAREGVAGEVGVLGVSRGTEAAVLVADRHDHVGAVVAYAPSAYAWPGRGGDGPGGPAWTVDGDPIPPVPPADGEATPEEAARGLRTRPVFERCVADAGDDELAAAALPVEGVDADVLLVSGREDGVWHADEMADTLAARLRDAGAADRVVHRCYGDFGHQAGVPYRPTTGRAVATPDDHPPMVHGGTPAGIAAAEADAWEATLDVLGRLSGATGDGA